MSIGFGHIWVPDHLDKSSFGGVVGKEAQVEKIKERIRDGEEMTVTVDNCLKYLAVQKKAGKWDNIWKETSDQWQGFLKKVILEHGHLQLRMKMKMRRRGCKKKSP